uniref:Uncharacterized protein n=1 Tax=Arundo donax TaxID=35708 RepID=A0A0A9DWK7_ARUDO
MSSWRRGWCQTTPHTIPSSMPTVRKGTWKTLSSSTIRWWRIPSGRML